MPFLILLIILVQVTFSIPFALASIFSNNSGAGQGKASLRSKLILRMF
jgi:hypothetical protein